MSGSEKQKKKGEQEHKQQIFCEHIRHFLHKTCNSEVSHYNNNGKEMYKKECCTCKVVVLVVFVLAS